MPQPFEAILITRLRCPPGSFARFHEPVVYGPRAPVASLTNEPGGFLFTQVPLLVMPKDQELLLTGVRDYRDLVVPTALGTVGKLIIDHLTLFFDCFHFSPP